MDGLTKSAAIAASGLNVQAERLRVVAENVANANATGSRADVDPYRRKTISFEAVLQDASEVSPVQVAEIGHSSRPFRIHFDPGHPAADRNGNVRMANVDLQVEMADLAEANRTYLANLQVVRQSRELVSMTIDLLRP